MRAWLDIERHRTRGTARPVTHAWMRSEARRGRPYEALGYDRAMPTLSRADVEHVAHLARLGLSEDELTRLQGQLNHILDQYAILARLDTEHIPPTAQTIELENILREDVPGPSLPASAAIGNAAEHAGGFIVVPRIIADAAPAAEPDVAPDEAPDGSDG
jgi:aspartyl-tRNA(Asn)/glutamyl-tRNA(Gln) amidotransferase subunit C